MKQELSTLTVDKILEAQQLPDNFEKLSPRKQKEIIMREVGEVYMKVLEVIDFKYKAKEAEKKLVNQVKQNPANIKLAALRKQIKLNFQNEKDLLARFYGMKHLASALGFDKKLLEQIQQIEQ